MKKLLSKWFGVSWKTTLTGYFLAILIAIQPLLTDTIDWDSKQEVARYVIRLLIASAIAILGKQAADSQQVKIVDQKVDEHIDETPSRNDQQLGA